MTTLTQVEGTSIIKADEIGRRQTPATRREQLLDEFERSGLSGSKFAVLAGVKYSTFAAWAHRRRKPPVGGVQAPVKPGDPVRWLEALVAPNASAVAVAVVLQLPGGVRLELHGPQQAPLAAALLRELAKPC